MLTLSLIATIVLALVEHIGTAGIFNFTISTFSRQVNDFFMVCPSSLTATQEQIIFFQAKRYTAPFFKQKVSSPKYYRNSLYTEEEVDPSKLLNTTNYTFQNPTTRYAGIAYSIVRANATNCKISRIVRTNVQMMGSGPMVDIPVKSFSSQTLFGLTCYNDANKSLLVYNASACKIARTNEDLVNYTAPHFFFFQEHKVHMEDVTSSKPAHIFIIDRQTNTYDWDSKPFWKLLWQGLAAMEWSAINMDLYNRDMWYSELYIGSYANWDYPWNRLRDDRLNTDKGYGLKLNQNEEVKVKFTAEIRGRGLSFIYIIYNVSNYLYATGRKHTIEATSPSGVGTDAIDTKMNLKIEFDSSARLLVTMVIDAKLIWNNQQLSQTVTWPSTWTHPADFPGDALTVQIVLATNPSDLGGNTSQLASAVTVGSATIHNQDVHSSLRNPMNPTAANLKKYVVYCSNEYDFADNWYYNITALDRQAISKAYTSDGLNMDTRMRGIVSLFLVPDYDTFLGSDYSISVASEKNLCPLAIPDAFSFGAGTDGKCNNLVYSTDGWSTYVTPNCNIKLTARDVCEYCDPGYGADLLNSYGYPQSAMCRTQANCGDYFKWDEGSLTPNGTNKALCSSCPNNCVTCDRDLKCTSCPSTYAALVADRCRCNVPNCQHCTNTTCNRCAQFNTLNNNGYVLHIIRATGIRSCEYRTTNSCLDGSGFTHTDYYDFKPIDYFPVCENCTLTGCLLCAMNSTKCTKCGTSLSLANKSDALDTDYLDVQICENTGTIIKGLVEDPPNNVYIQCSPWCWTCLFSDITSCSKCHTNYYWVQRNRTCTQYPELTTRNSACYLDPLILGAPTQGSTICKNCLSDCVYCLNSTACIDCRWNYYYHVSNATCVSNSNCAAPTKSFQTTMSRDGGNYRTCVNCMDNCTICQNANDCDGCTLGFWYKAAITKCLNLVDCRVTMSYPNNDTVDKPVCTDCGRGCEWCWSSTSCDSCLNSQTFAFHVDQNLCVLNTSCVHTNKSWFDTPANQCHFCRSDCTGCTSSVDCWLCNPGLFLDINNASCFSACQTYQTNMNSTHCIACPPNCKTCSYDNATGNFTCLTCDTEYYIDAEGTCNPCTSRGVFPNGTRCEVCLVKDCERCVNLSTTCKICDFGFYVNASKKCAECLQPDVYTLDRLCLTCQPTNCVKCKQYDILKCETCDLGYYADDHNLCRPKEFFANAKEFRIKNLKFKVTFEQKVKPFVINDTEIHFTNLANQSQSQPMNITSIEPDKTSNKTWYFTIQNLPDFENFLPVINFTNLTKIESQEKPGYFLSVANATIVFNKGDQLLMDDMKGADAVSNAMSTGMNVAIVVSAIISFNYAVILMKIYQMMDFMLLYSVAYPSNFEKFISVFNAGNPVDMLPDIFVGLYDDNCKELGEKFESQGMSCQFMQNTSTTFLVVIIWVTGKVLMTIVSLPFPKSSCLGQKIKIARDKLFGPEMMFGLISMFDVDIHLGAFTNSKFYAGDNLTDKSLANNLLANSYIYLYPLLIFYYFYKNRQLVQYEQGKLHHMPPSTTEYYFLVKHQKMDTFYSCYTETLALLRNYLICCFVVGFYLHPRLQLISVMSVLGSFCALEVKYQPRKSKLENTVQACGAGLYTIITLLFLSVGIMETNSVSKRTIYTYVGYPLTGLFAILILVNITPSVIGMIGSIKETYQKCKTKKKPAKTDGESRSTKIQSSGSGLKPINSPSIDDSSDWLAGSQELVVSANLAGSRLNTSTAMINPVRNGASSSRGRLGSSTRLFSSNLSKQQTTALKKP